MHGKYLLTTAWRQPQAPTYLGQVGQTNGQRAALVNGVRTEKGRSLHIPMGDKAEEGIGRYVQENPGTKWDQHPERLGKLGRLRRISIDGCRRLGREQRRGGAI